MSEGRRLVLVSCLHLQRNLARYRPILDVEGIDVEAPTVTQQLSEAELLGMISRFDGVIAGDDEFTAAVLRRAPNLKILVKWGIGMDAIDLTTAAELGIQVRNTPAMFGGEVADVTIGYIIMLARRLHVIDRAVRRGEWLKPVGVSLAGKTLGVVGAGDIGGEVCRRALAMGMTVLAYDVAGIRGELVAGGVIGVESDELLEKSDIISLCCPLVETNRHMLGEREFGLMKKGVFVVNTSRGPLIDEKALVSAVETGQVAGAALDVFESEPLPADSPLMRFENCIFGSHNSSNTLEAVERVNEKAVELLIDGLKGRK